MPTWAGQYQDLQMGDAQTSLTQLSYSLSLACSEKRARQSPQAVWHLAVGRQIKPPKSFYCRVEQIDLQTYGMASLCWKDCLAPTKISGKSVAGGPGAITSSSSYWQVDKSSASYHSLAVPIFFSLVLLTHLIFFYNCWSSKQTIWFRNCMQRQTPLTRTDSDASAFGISCSHTHPLQAWKGAKAARRGTGTPLLQ